MAPGPRRARVEDVHELAMRMPHVTIWPGKQGNPVYQVGGKSFVFVRTPRPDAFDPVTGERYPDVIMFWVPSESDKQALVQDEATPFFTTPHFDGHPSILVRAGRIGELTVTELTEVIQDAWLARASSARAAAWLSACLSASDVTQNTITSGYRSPVSGSTASGRGVRKNTKDLPPTW
jgi:hypothetical protein